MYLNMISDPRIGHKMYSKKRSDPRIGHKTRTHNNMFIRSYSDGRDSNVDVLASLVVVLRGFNNRIWRSFTKWVGS